MPAQTDLLALLKTVVAEALEPLPTERLVLDRIDEFRLRLQEQRFQLAVVGQFKRGKSSLLNALLGTSVLPTGVLPLTAIPTFIAYGEEPSLYLVADGEAQKDWAGESSDELRRKLAALVTEAGNPHNCKHVSHVDIALPAPLLDDGLVMIDTPGIGSAEPHNTVTARAALPECDGALIVLSPDPPITEVEIAYIVDVRQNAALIIPVLNKIDLVTGAERAASLDYLASVLTRIGISEPIIAVSSREALEGGAAAQETGGMAQLTARIRALSSAKRHQALQAAIARKAAAAVNELIFQNHMALAALTAPIETLQAKIAEIGEATRKIEGEQAIVFDFLAAERRRHANRIDADAAVLRDCAIGDLHAVLNVQGELRRDAVFARITNRIEELFSRAYREVSEIQSQRLVETAGGITARLEPLLARVRQAASEALGVDFVAPVASLTLAARPALAWVQRPADSLSPFAPGFLDSFLPSAVRAKRVRRAMEREIERLVTINVERLRWELQRSTIEALRLFETDIATAFKTANGSVNDLIESIRRLREKSQSGIETQINSRIVRKAALAEAAAALNIMLPRSLR